MRQRLSRTERRASILKEAREIILKRGFTDTEMEDIRTACGVSRGGLYHHFGNKRAILNALIADEVAALASVVEQTTENPIPALLQVGSMHLGAGQGILSGMTTAEDQVDYLSGLEAAFAELLAEPLAESLRPHVAKAQNPKHVAELFLTVNSHINRQEILGNWTSAEAAGFAATALQAIAPLLGSPKDLEPLIDDLRMRETS